MSSRYAELGIDIKKRGVEYFKQHIQNLYPEAFCVVQRDPDSPEKGIVVHSDSAGSKPVQSYLHWKETDDSKWFKGLAQDVVAMNLDDIICVGAQPVSFLDYVAINPMKVEKQSLLRSLAEGFSECFSTLSHYGMGMLFSGGETADLPDQIRTFDISGSIFGRVDLASVISGNRIREGDLIVGLRSGGKICYERNENSGIMCNGLTLARLSLMQKRYHEKYPELGEGSGSRFQGRYNFDDYLDDLGMTVGEALLSPTRLFAPVVFKILESCGTSIHSMVHNTGGGLTKCLRIGRGTNYLLDNLPIPDPVFLLIQKESGVSWKEMYEDYNMGIGFEICLDPEAVETALSVADSFKLGASVIGRCEKGIEGNALNVESRFGKFKYSMEEAD